MSQLIPIMNADSLIVGESYLYLEVRRNLQLVLREITIKGPPDNSDTDRQILNSNYHREWRIPVDIVGLNMRGLTRYLYLNAIGCFRGEVLHGDNAHRIFHHTPGNKKTLEAIVKSQDVLKYLDLINFDPIILKWRLQEDIIKNPFLGIKKSDVDKLRSRV